LRKARKLIGLVRGTRRNGFLELNRMAFSDRLPRNSESRALGVVIRALQKHRPDIEWLVSFADACLCGDGTIYRAGRFRLCDYSRGTMYADPNGKLFQSASVTARGTKANKEALALQARDGGSVFGAFARAKGLKKCRGFSLRYIYFLNPDARARLTVPELPFSTIKEIGASMYRGRRRKHSGDAPGGQPGDGGSSPTPALQQARI